MLIDDVESVAAVLFLIYCVTIFIFSRLMYLSNERTSVIGYRSGIIIDVVARPADVAADVSHALFISLPAGGLKVNVVSDKIRNRFVTSGRIGDVIRLTVTPLAVVFPNMVEYDGSAAAPFGCRSSTSTTRTAFPRTSLFDGSVEKWFLMMDRIRTDFMIALFPSRWYNESPGDNVLIQ